MMEDKDDKTDENEETTKGKVMEKASLALTIRTMGGTEDYQDQRKRCDLKSHLNSPI
jgi:hypothetical protein